MEQLTDDGALQRLTQSEFGHHEPFIFVYDRDASGHYSSTFRHGDQCYVLKGRDGYFYVFLDGKIEREKQQSPSD